MKSTLKSIPILSLILTLSILAGCGQSPSDTSSSSSSPSENSTETVADSADVASFINKENEVAIKGTDPTAYFTEGSVVEGSDEFAHEWNGATWHFASAENRDLFIAEPEKYAPQYGGHCAWAAAEGYVADIDPEAWNIVDGRLYLNFNQDVKERWERGIPGFIETADANWPGIVAENS